MCIFVHQGTPLVNCRRKHLEPKRKVFLKYPDKVQFTYKIWRKSILWPIWVMRILGRQPLKNPLLQNGYPQGVITYNINDVLNRNKNKSNDPVLTVPKKDLILLRYLGLHSNQVAKRLKSCVYKFYSCINLKVIFQNTSRVKSYFPYKDRLNRSQMSRIIYKAGCWDCKWILYRQDKT